MFVPQINGLLFGHLLLIRHFIMTLLFNFHTNEIKLNFPRQKGVKLPLEKDLLPKITITEIIFKIHKTINYCFLNQNEESDKEFVYFYSFSLLDSLTAGTELFAK